MKLSQAAKVVGGVLTGDAEFVGADYDSRTVKKGNLFVCLKGERTDGHKYVKSAEENGAVAVLCEREVETDLPCLRVENSLAAFQKIAEYYKSTLDISTVAVTGSVGKTTTKEFIAAVLSQKYVLSKTQGNKNSDIGLPATLLDIESTAEAAVLEMGMSNFGEISLLSKITHPDIAVITNIGYSHIEYLGSRENILKAKLEIVDGMDKNGILILNADDEIISASDSLPEIKKIFYGIGCRNAEHHAAEYRAVDIISGPETTFTAITPKGEFDVSIPIEGLHNVYNALAAIAVGQLMDMDFAEIQKGLSTFKNAPMRQNIYQKDGILYIEDCYNAAPNSVAAALNVLHMKHGRRIAVLGDMLELGSESERLHEMTGTHLRSDDILISFGNFAENYACGAKKIGMPKENIYICKTTPEAAEVLHKIMKQGDVVLVKASRGMKAEEILK